MSKPFSVAALVLGLAATAVHAQVQQVQQDNAVVFYQQRQTYQQGNVMVAGPGAQPILAGMVVADGRMGLLNVTGKPFSATETRRTVQPLANGAKIEHSDSNLFYRDDQGRTRAEQTVDGRAIIVIMDPVAKSVIVLNRDQKTAKRVAIPGSAQQGSVSVANGGVTMLFGATILSPQSIDAHASQSTKVEVRVAQIPKSGSAGRHNTEDLGSQYVNGVLAQGTRDTLIIPAGSIGNDRDLQVVDEHWFSADLQTLVKSLNSDPRFGETTYQLTNIVRASQDLNLFQIPTDYTVTEETRLGLELKPALPGK